jgi:hypothetical protein
LADDPSATRPIVRAIVALKVANQRPFLRHAICNYGATGDGVWRTYRNYPGFGPGYKGSSLHQLIGALAAVQIFGGSWSGRLSLLISR